MPPSWMLAGLRSRQVFITATIKLACVSAAVALVLTHTFWPAQARGSFGCCGGEFVAHLKAMKEPYRGLTSGCAVSSMKRYGARAQSAG